MGLAVQCGAHTHVSNVAPRSPKAGSSADLPLAAMTMGPSTVSSAATGRSTASVLVLLPRRRVHSCRWSSAAPAGQSSLPRSSIAAGQKMRLPGQSASCPPPCLHLIPCVSSMPALGTSMTSIAAACRATRCSTEGAQRRAIQCVRSHGQQQST